MLRLERLYIRQLSVRLEPRLDVLAEQVAHRGLLILRQQVEPQPSCADGPSGLEQHQDARQQHGAEQGSGFDEIHTVEVGGCRGRGFTERACGQQ